MDRKTTQLMDAVYNCLGTCNMCYEACLQEDHIDMLRACIRSDKDCADICAHVLSYKGREELMDVDLVKLCEKSCLACGKECEKHEKMEHCQKCAKACFDCAEACRNYVNA